MPVEPTFPAIQHAKNLTELLPQIAMPCLVIHEPGFPFGSFELCQQVASGIPNAQFVIVGGKSIAGSMHEGHVTAIDQFLRSGSVTQSISVASGSSAGAPRFIAPDGLTPREVEVLTRVAAGMTNKAIAAELGVAGSEHRASGVPDPASGPPRDRLDALTP